jgi:hypothetical protein
MPLSTAGRRAGSRKIRRIMWRIVKRAVLAAGVLLAAVLGALAVYGVPAPPGFTVEGMPRVPWAHVWRSTRIVSSFSAQRTFAGWYGHERRMLVTRSTVFTSSIW